MDVAISPVGEDAPPPTAALADAQHPFLSIVVLGASGDLAKKKTFPALFQLFCQGFLPKERSCVVGYARSPMTDEALRERIRPFLKHPTGVTAELSVGDVVEDFLSMLSYTAGPYDQPQGFQALEERLAAGEEGAGLTRRLFYMALPPGVYPPVAAFIRQYNMPQTSNPNSWTRVIVEKPFGKDSESADNLSAALGEVLSEDQLYRIDHYLGKEVVQNLLVLRFANRLLMPLWNRDHIANVQIVFKEDFGTEGRGGYFDEYGIIRDIIQNHLLQVLCLVAMEPPVSLSPEDVRNEKVKVLRSISPILPEEVVLGQYQGYREDPTVPDDSHTPTFAAMVLRIDNERWDGVPFIMKAGKALDGRKAEVRVQFRPAAGNLFARGGVARDELVMRLQPDEAIYMKLMVKEPGLEMALGQSELDLSYKSRYEHKAIPEAYERLILDAIRGDQQHFVRRDELKVAWEIFTPLLHTVEDGKFPVIEYPQGGRGPVEADKLLENVGYVRNEGYVWKPLSNAFSL